MTLKRIIASSELEAFRQVADSNRLARLQEENADFRAALLSIAALNDGPVVHGGFDDPDTAAQAREVLSKHWIGPCVHGRDPWDRCDKCSSAGQVVAWAMAQIGGGK